MLFLRSKELKNSNKNAYRTVCYALFVSFFFTFNSYAQSSPQTNSLSNPSSVLSIFLSLLLVVAIIFALAWLMRRFNVTQAGNGQMKMVASMMAGTKEKVIVIEVGEEQYLLGVTANQINHLATLDKPLKTNKKQGEAAVSSLGQGGFQQKLATAMAQAINPNVKGKPNND